MPTAAGPRFLVLEGIDGSGTTTQVTRLVAALRERGHAVLETREPSAGPVGQLARAQLSAQHGFVPHDTLALLFAADRLDHVAREIEPALDRGEVVVCDRYLLSSLAYQSLHCPMDWVESINRRARAPDLTVLLDVDADTAIARVEARRHTAGTAEERFDRHDLQRRLAMRYRQLAGDPERTGMLVLDGNRSADEVAAQLLAVCVSAGL